MVLTDKLSCTCSLILERKQTERPAIENLPSLANVALHLCVG